MTWKTVRRTGKAGTVGAAEAVIGDGPTLGEEDGDDESDEGCEAGFVFFSGTVLGSDEWCLRGDRRLWAVRLDSCLRVSLPFCRIEVIPIESQVAKGGEVSI